MSKKKFETVKVLQITTGRVLVDGGMEHVYEVMDHLYPGIMTLGIAAMQKTAGEEIKRQNPQLLTVGEPNDSNWKEWMRDALQKLPADFEIDGPHDVSEEKIQKAFGEMRQRMDSK